MKLPTVVKVPIYTGATLLALYLLCKSGKIKLGICQLDLSSFGAFINGLKGKINEELRLAFIAAQGNAGSGQAAKAIKVAEALAAGTSGSGGSGSAGSGNSACNPWAVPFKIIFAPGSKYSYLATVQISQRKTGTVNGKIRDGYKGTPIAGNWQNYPVWIDHKTLCALVASGQANII